MEHKLKELNTLKKKYEKENKQFTLSAPSVVTQKRRRIPNKNYIDRTCEISRISKQIDELKKKTSPKKSSSSKYSSLSSSSRYYSISNSSSPPPLPYRSPEKVSLGAQIRKGKVLKKVPSTEKRRKTPSPNRMVKVNLKKVSPKKAVSPPKNNILADIKKGVALKKVTKQNKKYNPIDDPVYQNMIKLADKAKAMRKSSSKKSSNSIGWSS